MGYLERTDKMRSGKTGSSGRKMVAALFALILACLLSPGSIATSAAEAGISASEGKTEPAASAQPSSDIAAEAGPSPLKTVVATVGNVAITEADLQEATQSKVKNIYTHGQDLSQKPEYRRDALNDLIEVELLIHEGMKKGTKIPDDFVDGVVEENRKSLGSEKALLETLEKRGLTMDAFRNRIRNYRMVNQFLVDLFRESAYSEEELKAYYEEHKESFRRPESVRIYNILLKVDASAPEEEWQKKKEKAEELLKKINAGEKFYDIAYYNSDDPYRVKGGDLGFIHKGMLSPEELEQAAFALKPDEVSGVIRTINGFHILKAGERKQGELLTFDKVKEDLAKKRQIKKFEEKKADILKMMRDTYPVKVYVTFPDKP